MNWNFSRGTETRLCHERMCWCIVLLEDEHASSNTAGQDRWQQLLHHEYVSVTLPVDFSPMSHENEVAVQPSFDTATETITDLLKVGAYKRRLALMSSFLVSLYRRRLYQNVFS